MNNNFSKYFTCVKFETDNTYGEIKSCKSNNESYIDINVDFFLEKDFKNNASLSIYDKEGNEVLNQDTLGSIAIKGDTNYFNKLRSRSVLSAIGDSYRIAVEDLRNIIDIDIVEE